MDPHGKLLYVATRDGGTVMEVDWRAMSVTRTFTFSGRPQDMAFSPDGQLLYVANEFNNVVHVIKLATGTFTNIPLAGGGEGLAIGNNGDHLYVGLVFAGYVQVVDRKSGETVRLILSAAPRVRSRSTTMAATSWSPTTVGGWTSSSRTIRSSRLRRRHHPTATPASAAASATA